MFYFYFDTRDPHKTTYKGLILSLLANIGTHKNYDQSELHSLYEKKQQGQHQIPSKDMKIVVLNILGKCVSFVTYIVIDALDECQREEKEEVVAFLKELLLIHNVSLFVTCRNPPFLEGIENQCLEIPLQQEEVMKDIMIHIDEAIRKPQSPFAGLENKIKDALVNGANGQ